MAKCKTLKEKYEEVKSLIDKVDFSLLWNGFKPLRFALYNEDECFFDGNYIEKTKEFIANTSIKYKDEIIAIWNVMEEIDSNILASKIIHEMFHGYQMLNNESRFPDELDALYKYKYSDENLSIKLEESKLIVSLLDNFNVNDFNRLLKYRRYRLTKFPYEFMYEAKIEQIEGTANFVELESLKQLSINAYLEKLNGLKNRLLDKNCFFPIRIISYDIGALLLTIFFDNEIAFNDRFNDEPFSIGMVKNINELPIDITLSFSTEIKDYFDKAQSIINKTLENNVVVVEGEYNLLGFNVYNAIYFKGYIISMYFVMYGEKAFSKIEYGNFVIRTKEYKKLDKIYKFFA